MTSLLPQGDEINLQLGWPSPQLFPAAELNNASESVLTNPEIASQSLIYGPNRGYLPLRSHVAQWLGKTYYHDKSGVDEDRVCIAGGASQNLANILLRFTDSSYTRNIWMVEPTYFLACPIFEDCGFVGKLRGVPEDEEGIDISFLRDSLARVEGERAQLNGHDAPRVKTAVAGYEKIYKHVIYCVPTFSNPSGKTMSLRRRYELVNLAIEYDALVVSDDVYDFLWWPEKKSLYPCHTKVRLPPRLVDVNREIDPDSKWGNTVSNGSFSKIVAPGVRVSWAEATPAFATWLANTGATWSGGNPAHLSSTFIEDLFSSGALEKHISQKLIPTYAARYYGMVDAIQKYLEPLGVQITTGRPFRANLVDSQDEVILAGGFFLSLTIPEGYASAAVLAKAAIERYKLKFAYGKMFLIKGDDGSAKRSLNTFADSIRLCWAFHTEKQIEIGIKRLRDVLLDHKTL
ncbi:uncharacterized protein PV09_09421 [Verruconis gallopava]|uniref:Aminotransferase class I/classII large domain-containing protein n=1 Tax=Verruconis gallopava TaxID=253628 RepID=A0A0D1X9J8_9PEZI|nr:uncharacterized protein PV09_09421 [Verruconis gallopava]KIV98850.1 hypothetical protein PV09_09421 [Verruconis gallopava]